MRVRERSDHHREDRDDLKNPNDSNEGLAERETRYTEQSDQQPPSEPDRLTASLSGVVMGKNGKPAREAVVKVSSASDPAVAAQATTAKDGRYELLLWNVPTTLQLEVAAGQDSLRRDVTFDPPARRDVVEMATLDLDLAAP